MFIAVHEQSIIDFVRKYDELMFPRDFYDSFQDVFRIDSAGRIVRIDNYDCLGPVSDFRFQVCKVRVPFTLFVTEVVNSLTACERRTCGPQRIVGGRDEDLVAIIEECRHAEVDKFRCTVSGVYIIHGKVRDVPCLCILHDGFSCSPDALGVRIAFRFSEVGGHVVDDFFRGAESERGRVAYVEL